MTGRSHYPAVLRLVTLCVTLAGLATIAGPAVAADKNVDLDGKTANGSESNTNLTVLATFPVKVRNKVTNKAVGDAFTFRWLSAGPGGFSSSLTAGTATGVGASWTWETTQSVFSFTGSACTNDICFTKTAGPDPVTSRGPFSAPGRSLTTSGVTVTSASLTSSLLTFFSPPTVLATVTSSVQPLGGGGFAYQTRLENKTSSPINIQIAPTPPGCCPDVHQKNCSGTCVYYLDDPKNCGSCGNACAVGEVCSAGACVPDCPGTQKSCNGSCVDISSDPANCGACGHACGSNQICSAGACTTCRPPVGTACSNQCVNIHTDAYNCGGCGINCNFQCPSTGHGVCSQGQSCQCVQSLTAPILPDPDEAPVCETPGQTQTVPPGGVAQSCVTGAVLAKEQPSKFTVCGSSIPDGPTTCQNGDPATEGTFNVLLPDLTKTPGDVYPTPAHMELVDPSGDGVIEPGETFGIKIALLNAGSKTLTGVTGTLTSPPVDVSDDGVANPVNVNITSGVSAYPDLAGLPLPSGDCSNLTAPAAVSNATNFTVSIPATHPGDVGRPFNLKITGTIAATATPFQMDVPLVLGIGSSCNPTLLDGRFDGVVGLANPMAKLVRPGDVVPYATSQQGKVRPLKLQVLCGTLNLNGNQIISPQIAGLSRNGVPLDISVLNLNDDSPNSLNPYFRWPTSGSNWIFNLNTKLLAKGTYVMTIRIGGDQDFVTGIILN